ncbi:hypothetical protein T265_07490 [Opisthorchis viverrini]|uniref:Reverse transcriptase domain-containing protein n=1 Tax=Opisthorchis viverrini TaxID=6198 RepID=A0A074ZCS9_OPIVI|nr:hypothetical protein T265_07490 [Opisthorchis viverrini]KER24983.1 hypothetical protein T265_07490 [Opisthorchis viverrini]
MTSLQRRTKRISGKLFSKTQLPSEAITKPEPPTSYRSMVNRLLSEEDRCPLEKNLNFALNLRFENFRQWRRRSYGYSWSQSSSSSNQGLQTNSTTGRSVVRIQPRDLDFPYLRLGNLAVFQLAFKLRESTFRFTITIMDGMPSFSNTDASLPYNHNLFESLTLKKIIRGWGRKLALANHNQFEKVRGSNLTSASRLLLSILQQLGSIPAIVLLSGGMAAGHRKDSISARRAIPATSDYDGACRSLNYRIIRSLKNGRGRWWILKAPKMRVFAAGNSRFGQPVERRQISAKRYAKKKERQFTSSIIAEHLKERISWKNSAGPNGTLTPANHQQQIKYPTRHDIYPGCFTPRALHPLTPRSSCENHRGISLVSVAFQVLSGIVLRAILTPRIRNFGGVWRLNVSLPNLHPLWGQCMWIPVGAHKYTASFCLNSPTPSDVRQGCLLSSFIFDFIIDKFPRLFPKLRRSKCPSGRSPTDIRHVDNITLLDSYPCKIQTILNNLNNSTERRVAMCTLKHSTLRSKQENKLLSLSHWTRLALYQKQESKTHCN